MKKTILALAISIAILSVTTLIVIAAPGNLLFQVNEPEPMVSCCGIGIDYDGTKILYTHYGDPTIHFTDLSGADLGALPLINPDGSPFSGGLNAIAYNFNDGMLYGGGWSSRNLYKTDPSTGVTTLVKANAVPGSYNFIDGLAWDPRDNSFWMSDDVTCSVRHLDANGNDIGGFDGCSLTGYGNSGLAVGLDGTLFYGTNGAGRIFTLDTTTSPPTNLGQFASPGGRDEDMVCGPEYTKPDGTKVETLLSQDAYGNWFVAIEVAPETCISPATNAAPIADANGPYSGDEGSAISIDGTGSSDPDGNALTYAWSYTAGAGVDAGASCTFGDASAGSTTITCSDDGPYNLTLTVDDGTVSDSDSTTVTVANVAPDLTITSPSAGSLYAVNTAVNLSGSFSDQGTNDTHTCSIDWDDGAGALAGTVTETAGSGTCTSSKSYASAGVYNIAVMVTDDDGGSDTETVMVVVYDPSAGFVTGGGWIDSPAGAYKPDDALAGKATFGFVSKYQKGATIPTGSTEFQFHAAGMNFHSETYQWLVVNQAGTSAQFKGSGTINGSLDTNGNPYKFMLWAGDGSPDTFRIRIWSEDSLGVETAVYDNGFDQALGGGSIIIHKAK